MKHDNALQHVQLSPEQRQDFAKTLHQSLVAQKERDWDVIIHTLFKGRSLSPMEKGIFDVAFALAIQAYALHLTENCSIVVKMAPKEPDETSLPMTTKVH